MIHWYWITLICFVIVNLVDIILTHQVLKQGGEELNPLFNFMLRLRIPIPVAKTVLVCLVMAIVFVLFGGEGFKAMFVANILLAGVCIWNFIQWEKSRRR